MTLNDRERFVLHAMSLMVVDVMIKKFNEKSVKFDDINPLTPDILIEQMKEIRKYRCKTLSEFDINKLYDDINEELMLGKHVNDNI